MLVYIIDGFNLVYKVPSLKKSVNPRKALINYIQDNGLTGSRNNKVIVVFDGFKNLDDTFYGCEVVFSGERKADDIIKNKVKNAHNKRQIVVVSDDREIIDSIKAEGAVSISVFGFIKKKHKKEKEGIDNKDISYSLQREITEDLRKHYESNS